MKLLFTCIACLSALVPLAQPSTSLPFRQLTGTWIMEKKDGVIMGETWAKKNDTSMTGKSFLVRKGDTTLLETVDLIQEGADVFYIPVAYGQNGDQPVRFKLTSSWVFENPAHDFPRRIVYDFVDAHTLHAYIDDGAGNKTQHYHYKKQP